MDGFQPYRPGRMPVMPPLAHRSHGLHVPDFDAPLPEHDPAAEEAERAERVAMLAAARAEGHASGLAEGLRQADESREAVLTRTLHAAAAAMEDAAGAARVAVDQASEAVARLLLAALDAALPAASARLGAQTAARLAASLRPVLEEVPGLRLAVAPGLGATCAAAIGDARIEVTEDAALPPGDARATWRGGEAAMELARQREMVAEVLHALGLQGQ